MAVNTFTGATDSNWGTAGNWSLAAIPTASDGHVATFDASSPNCTVATNVPCNTLNMTDYVNTLTLTGTVSVSGDITLPTGAATIAGAGGLTIAATGRTITPNGFVWPNPFSTSTAVGAITLGANFTVNGLFTVATVGSSTCTFTSNTLTLGGGLTHTNTSGVIAGTTNIVMAGTGTVNSRGQVRNNFTINTSGTITFSGTNFIHNTGTFTYTAGTVVASSTTLYNGTAFGANWDVAGITWSGVNIAATATTTLLSNINVSGTATLGVTTQTPIINGFAINCGTSVVHSSTTGNVNGTTVLNIAGTCSITAPTTTTGSINLPTVFASTAVITIAPAVRFQTGKLVNNSLNVTTTSAWVSGGGQQSYAFIG